MGGILFVVLSNRWPIPLHGRYASWQARQLEALKNRLSLINLIAIIRGQTKLFKSKDRNKDNKKAEPFY